LPQRSRNVPLGPKLKQRQLGDGHVVPGKGHPHAADRRAALPVAVAAVAERFGPSARTTCSAYFLITRTLASTVRIVAIAKVLEVVTGGGLSYQGCVFVVVFCILAYGGIIRGVVPTSTPISWENHLAGLVTGASLAWFMAKLKKTPSGLSEVVGGSITQR